MLRFTCVLSGLALIGGCSLVFAPSDDDKRAGYRIWGGSAASHFCISRGTKLSCWGTNRWGQLGRGDGEAIGDDERADDAPYIGEFPSDIHQVALTESHTCAVTVDGDTYCWGDGEYGPLGYADSKSINSMISEAGAVRTGLAVEGIIVDRGLSCVYTADAVRCFGSAEHEQHCALLGQCPTNDLGDNEFPKDIPAMTLAGDISELAQGEDHSCAVLVTGQIQCWGANSEGQLGTAAPTDAHLSPPIASEDGVHGLAVGSSFTCGIDDTGDVRCWGRNDRGQLGVASTEAMPLINEASTIGFQSKVVKLVAGQAHTCALFESGLVSCWGEGGQGALGRGEEDSIGKSDRASNRESLPLEGVVDISAGRFSSCALLTDGEVVCWGSSSSPYQTQDGTLGSGQDCGVLAKTMGCSFGDEAGETLDQAIRLKFDF